MTDTPATRPGEAPTPPTAPRPSSRLRALLLVGAPLALLIAYSLAAANLARGRVLHVVNATPRPVVVRIDGGSPLTLPRDQRQAVPLPEGDHVATVERDGQTSTVPVPMRTSWLSRLTARPTWVLNVAGAAPLRLETAVYVEGTHETRPARVLFGEAFLALDGVDLAFEPFPQEVEGSTSVLTRVDVLRVAPVAVLGALPVPRRMDWAELWLELDPGDEALLGAYRGLLDDDAAVARYTAFLERRLEERPALVPWHRAYQDLQRARGREEDLLPRYASYIEAAPADAGLLYLAGRLEVEAPAAQARYDAALAADQGCAYAWHGRSFLAFARGDLDEALRCATKACELRPADAEMRAHRDEVRLALGRHEELQRELEAALEREPMDQNAHRRLLEVLVARGDPTGAVARHEAFVGTCKKAQPDLADRHEVFSSLALADLEQDGQRLLELCRRETRPLHRARYELAGHLAAGDVARAAQVAGVEPLARASRDALLVSIAYARAGDAEQAKAWRLRGAERLITRRELRVAELLKADRAPAPAELDRLPLPPVEMATVCLALADAWPSEAAWLRERAARCTHGRYFPAWFLRQR